MSIVLGIAAGLAAATAGNLQYPAEARFHVTGPIDSCRKELLNYVWQAAHRGDAPGDWGVDSDEAGRSLTLRIIGTDAQRVDRYITDLASGFKSHLEMQAAEQMSETDKVTELIRDVVTTLNNDLEKSSGQIGGAPPVPHNDDPILETGALRADIQSRIRSFDALRDTEREVAERLRRIVGETPIVRVSAETREAAYERRTDLQQDLDQLRVQLTLIKRSLQKTGESTSPSLETLMHSTTDLAQLSAEGHGDGSPATAFRKAIETLAARAAIYRNRLTSFAERWTDSFAGSRGFEVSPLTPRVLDLQAKLHDFLAEFSFHAERLVDDMRQTVKVAGELAADDPRLQERLARAKRAFYRFEADHRQFEFIAADVHRRKNFELDAHLKSALGLRRRIHSTTTAIDAELEAEARARAKTRQFRERRETELELERVRGECFTAAEELMLLIPLWEKALAGDRARLLEQAAAAAAAERIRDAESRNERTRALLNDVVARHQEKPAPICFVNIEYRRTDQTPINLNQRLALASAIGLGTFAFSSLITGRFRP